VLYAHFAFILIYYSLSTTVFQKRDSFFSTGYYYPSYRVWLASLAALVILFLVEEMTKRTIRELYHKDHLRL
jgi:hypothetical protein